MSGRRRLRWLGLLTLVPVSAWAGWPSPPVPDGSAQTEVARRIRFNGLDMQASMVSTHMAPDALVDFYRRAWKGAVVVNTMGDAQVVGHRDGDYFITVQIRRAGSGSTGTVGIVDVAHAAHDFQRGHGLPQPRGSVVFNDISYPDDATPARTVAMEDPLSPQQNASFFRTHLLADGWKPSGDNACTRAACLQSYSRGDSKLSLVVNPARDRSRVFINVLNP